MRLLQCCDTGEFSLTKDFVGDDTIPPYAILSHTWKEGQEVTFQDIIDGTGQSKTGYDKIRFCGQQAEHDGLRYFWVDTCCIDKSNKAELQKAIDRLTECTWESAFRASRWFTRGWTLQELLAPASVEFFSHEGKRLGDKSSLQQQVCEITGVPQSALQRVHLSKFSDKERFSWIECRQTKDK